MLAKIQEIAEKIQNNTSKMIVDGQFLRQEDVAQMVLNLSDEDISKLINGRIMPNDHIFYPVKPIIGTSLKDYEPDSIKGKVVVITITSSATKGSRSRGKIRSNSNSIGVEKIVILTGNQSDRITDSRIFIVIALIYPQRGKCKDVFLRLPEQNLER